MPQNSVVKAAAWLEIVVGAIFVTVPDIPCRLLFAVAPGGVGVPLGRFAGIALFALGTACAPSTTPGSRRSAVLGLLIYNAGAVIFLTTVALATTFRGFLLWPVVILHGAIAAALLPQFLPVRSERGRLFQA